MSEELISLLAEDRERISYRPRLNSITGGVLATILLQQIIYWWQKHKRKPFYKFAAPTKHAAYRAGDSWQEELGFSRSEFDTALKKIAIKVGAHEDLRKYEDDYLVFYRTDFQRKTWYELNERLLAQRLHEIYGDSGRPPIPQQSAAEAAPRNAGILQYEARNAGFQHYEARNAGFQHHVLQDSSISYCGNPAIDLPYTETTPETTPPPPTPAALDPPIDGGGGKNLNGKPNKTELYHWLRSHGVDSPAAAERNQHHDLVTTQAMYTHIVGDSIGADRKRLVGRFIRALDADGPIAPPPPANGHRPAAVPIARLDDGVPIATLAAAAREARRR